MEGSLHAGRTSDVKRGAGEELEETIDWELYILRDTQSERRVQDNWTTSEDEGQTMIQCPMYRAA